MVPEETEVVNVQYFQALVARAETIVTQSALQELVDEAFGTLNEVFGAIGAEVAALTPIVALLSPPTSPSAVVGWVGNFIALQLQPQLYPVVTSYVAQVAALTTQVGALTQAIEKQAEAIAGCVVTIPTLQPLQSFPQLPSK